MIALVRATVFAGPFGPGGVPCRLPPHLGQLARTPPECEEEKREGDEPGEIEDTPGDVFPFERRNEIEDSGEDVGYTGDRKVHPTAMPEPSQRIPTQDQPPGAEHQSSGPAQEQNAYQSEGMRRTDEGREDAHGAPYQDDV